MLAANCVQVACELTRVQHSSSPPASTSAAMALMRSLRGEPTLSLQASLVLPSCLTSTVIAFWANGMRGLASHPTPRAYQALTNVLVFWSILGCVVIGIVIIATSDKNSASYVFTGFDNTTGWDDGVAWILGLLQTSLSLIGFDAVAHMTEEMPHPTRDAPVAMIAAVIIGGVTGTGFILIILFAMTDVPTILASPTKQPLTELVYQATGSRAAAVVLSVVPAICFINGTNGCVTSGSRLLWAMARDGGSPFSQYLSKVDPKLHVPVRAIMMAAIFNMLFGLLYLGPSVAFNAYIASCTIFLNASYAGPVMIVLIRGRQIVLNNRPDFSMGYLGGLAANWVSVLFVVFITIVRLAANQDLRSALINTLPVLSTTKRNPSHSRNNEYVLFLDALRQTIADKSTRLRLCCCGHLHHVRRSTLVLQTENLPGTCEYPMDRSEGCKTLTY